MNAIAIKDELYERIAKLLAMDVDQKQIGKALGLSESRISQLVDSDEIQSRVAEIRNDDFEQADLMNRGWDTVEEESLGVVLDYLNHNPDPEFALKAAAQANKASRRHNHHGQPRLNGGTNANAVINLSVAFINKLESMRTGPKEIAREAKRVDAMRAGQVETVLQQHTPKHENADDHVIEVFTE